MAKQIIAWVIITLVMGLMGHQSITVAFNASQAQAQTRELNSAIETRSSQQAELCKALGTNDIWDSCK